MGYEDLEQKLKECSDDSKLMGDVVSFLNANPEPAMSTGFLLLITNYVSRTVDIGKYDRDFARIGLAYCKEVLKRNEPLSDESKRKLYGDTANLCWYIADLTRRPANKLKYLLKAYKYRSKVLARSHISTHYSTHGKLAHHISLEMKKTGDSSALKWFLISAKNKCKAGELAESAGEKQVFLYYSSAANRFFDAYQFSMSLKYLDRAILYAEKGAVSAAEKDLATLQLNLGKFFKAKYEILNEKTDWLNARHYYGEAQNYFSTHIDPISKNLIVPIKKALETLCAPRPVDHNWHKKEKWVQKRKKRENERKIIEDQLEELS